MSSPLGAAACVSQTQEAPSFGGDNWNSGPGAKLPNILGQRNRKNMCICVCVSLLRQRHGQINLAETFHISGTLREIRPCLFAQRLLCDSDAHPVRIHFAM